MADELRLGYELYFAYGSNMLSGRLMKRGIETVKVGNATLAGHTLRLRRDAVAKAVMLDFGWWIVNFGWWKA